MGIAQHHHFEAFDNDDPDDYRPDSSMAVVVDPACAADDIVVLFEKCAAGDRIPLHVHPVTEVIIIDKGIADVVVGDERRRVGEGAVLFIPAGVAHGLHNPGAVTLRLHAFFRNGLLAVRYLERNPRPGTEADPPAAPLLLDPRTGQMINLPDFYVSPASCTTGPSISQSTRTIGSYEQNVPVRTLDLRCSPKAG